MVASVFFLKYDTWRKMMVSFTERKAGKGSRSVIYTPPPEHTQ